MLYRILPGHSFRVDDETVKGAGELIELSEDTARLHAGKVELASSEPQAADEPAAQ
jgi:hypothetical protein